MSGRTTVDGEYIPQDSRIYNGHHSFSSAKTKKIVILNVIQI